MSAYELRTYQIAPDRMAAVIDVMKELVEPIMPDSIEGIGYWSSPDEKTLYWIAKHDSLDLIKTNWDRFHADPRWVEGLAARKALEPIVTHVASVSMLGRDGLPPLV